MENLCPPTRTAACHATTLFILSKPFLTRHGRSAPNVMENSESCSARLALPSGGLGFTAPTLARTRTKATKGREPHLQLRREPDRGRGQPDPAAADRDRAGQDRAGQDRAGQDRAERDRAERVRPVPLPPTVLRDRVLAHLAPAHPVLAHPGQPQANPALRPDQNLPANVAPRHNTVRNHNTTSQHPPATSTNVSLWPRPGRALSA